MKTYLLSVGQAAERALPAVLTALSCGATGRAEENGSALSSLDIFHITETDLNPVLDPMIRDFNECCRLFSGSRNPGFFSCSFSLSSCRPELPPIRELYENPASSRLLGALRGPGIPLAYKTDREAVEWAFSAMLCADPASEALSALFAWLEKVNTEAAEAGGCRFVLLGDLCGAFSAGILLALLPWLRKTLNVPDPFLSLIGLAELSSGQAAASQTVLRKVLSALSDRNLVRVTEGRDTAGADAAWVVSLPSSVSSEAAFSFLSGLASARVLGNFLFRLSLPSFGLHTLEIPAVPQLVSLDDRAEDTAAFLAASAWCLSDLFPSLVSYLEHPALLRSLSPAARSGLFRRLFRQDSEAVALPPAFPALQRSLKSVLSVLISFIQDLPAPLRFSEAEEKAWEAAVAACGRYVTVASEYDVSLAEARESGVDQVAPVHRVSLDDTEEEKALRRLDELADQLSSERNARTVALGRLGGFQALQVLSDCQNRCREAEETARKKLELLSSEEEPDRLRVGLQERRIRLLQAALVRCGEDLEAASAYPALAEAPSRRYSGGELFGSELIHPAAAAALKDLLYAEDAGREAAEKAVRDVLPNLIENNPLPDGRTLLRSLQPSAPGSDPLSPLAVLFQAAFSACREALHPLRAVSSIGSVPSIPLLPDALPRSPLLSVPGLLSILPVTDQADGFTHLRGLLAMLVLRQYRRGGTEEAVLTRELLRASDSPVLSTWLTSSAAESVWLISLEQKEQRLPAALILPGRTMLSAKWTAAHAALIPSFVSWFDADTLSFRDPCHYLGDSDRVILAEWLGLLLRSEAFPKDSAFSVFLSAFLEDVRKRDPAGEEDPLFSTRLSAACGLTELPAYTALLHRMHAWYEHALPEDRIASCLTGKEHFEACACDVPEEILYTYRGIPFARESSLTLLESLSVPEEKYILSTLDAECKILYRSSDDYRDALTRNLASLIERYPDALPARAEAARSLLSQARRPMKEAVTELSWPWDTASPAIRTILEECLGSPLAAAAVTPFSDMLTVFPARTGDIIGDSLLQEMCTLISAEPDPEDENQVRLAGDTFIPPLSPGFASGLCLLSEGKTLIQPSFLRFEKKFSNTVQVTVTLEGNFTLRLTRKYEENEILSLYAHHLPTLAVWPSVPFAPEDWHAYYVYARLSDSLRCAVTVSAEDPLREMEGNMPRRVMSLPSFPLCFVLYHQEKSVGALPNLLPRPEIPRKGIVLACVDFGSVGSSVVLADRTQRMPLKSPVWVRTILNHPSTSRDLLRREFLPAVPVSALLPSLVRLFRNQPGADPFPLEDGIIYMPTGLEDLLSAGDTPLYTSLKWEEEKGRAAGLFLHQLLLMTALEARCAGASSLFWRFGVPDGMALEGRERLLSLLKRLTSAVAAESGLSAPDKTPNASFATESSALGAYFRYCASEDTRGGFMVLDLGACTADLSLFLRGREQAVRCCQLSLGVHYMLLPALLRMPDLLTRDLSFVPDEVFLQQLQKVQELLVRSVSDAVSLRLARTALDTLVAERLPLLVSAYAQRRMDGQPGYLGSLLLLHFCYLMMLTGLLLLQIASDHGMNDILPEQMTLCLAGRGAYLMEALSPEVKTALWHFLSMFRNRRVDSLSLLFSSEKKLEIPVGLSLLQDVTPGMPMSATVPASVSVRPEELLPEFMVRFFRAFPQEAVLLFPGFYTDHPEYPLSPYGQNMILSAIQTAFTSQTVIRPYDALASWIGILLELVRTGG